MSFWEAEIERRMQNLLRLGTIAEIDNAQHLVRVKTGDILTQWLEYPADIGNNYHRWRPVRIGQQVLIACISGEINNALIVSMLYDNANPPPNTSASQDVIAFDDGTTLTYDSAESRLTAACVGDVDVTSGGKINATAATSITLDAPQTTITGRCTVEKLLTYLGGMAGSGSAGGGTAVIKGSIKVEAGDVTADGINLKTHTHGGVQSGSNSTGGPQ